LRGWFLEAVNAMVEASLELVRAGGVNRPLHGSLAIGPAAAGPSVPAAHHRASARASTGNFS
jgi:hypothetical protein